MPVDTKRITGPESSVSPYSFRKPEEPIPLLWYKAKLVSMDPSTLFKFWFSFNVSPLKEYPQFPEKCLKHSSKHKEVQISSHQVNNQQERRDGRQADKIRPIFLKTGVVSQAQGSAYIEQDGTKVICAVYGPRAVVRKEEFSMKGQLTCEFKFTTFSCGRRRQYQQDTEEKDYSVQLLEALEPAVLLHKFPKAQVNIYVTVLQNDGSALAVSITCASVAMADAGVEMYDLVTGCSARLAGDLLLLDPCTHEEYSSKEHSAVNNGSVTVGLMPSLNQISAVTSKGEIQFENMKTAISKCVEVCVQLYPVCQESLVKSVNTSIKENS